MKNWKYIFISICTIATASASNIEKAKKLYNEAIKLERKGEIMKALETYKKANDLAPEEIAIYDAYNLLNKRKDRLLYQQKLDKLQTIQIETIDLENEALSSAIRKISDLIGAHNKKNNTTHIENFVIRDKEVGDSIINLKMKNVPLSVVLENLMQLAKGKYKIEEYVISITKR